MTEAGVEFHQVSTTTGSRDVAEELARFAVTARFAACGQVVGPITSAYWWDGKVEQADEWLVLFKTAADRSAGLTAYLQAHHPYDVPEVIVTPLVGGTPAYLSWLYDETRPR